MLSIEYRILGKIRWRRRRGLVIERVDAKLVGEILKSTAIAPMGIVLLVVRVVIVKCRGNSENCALAVIGWGIC